MDRVAVGGTVVCEFVGCGEGFQVSLLGGAGAEGGEVVGDVG